MNSHLETVISLYEPFNIDIQSLIGWHLSHGIVLANSKFFAFGFHSYSEQPNKAVAFEHSDTLFVTMCSGDMSSALQPIKDDYKYIAFSRDFRGTKRIRLLAMEDFYSKLR